MTAIKTFSTSFLLKKSKAVSSKPSPIVMRITINGLRAEYATKEKIEPEKWLNGRAKGTSVSAKRVNNALDQYAAKAREWYRYLQERNEQITSSKIVSLLKGESISDKTLLQACDKYIHKISNLLGNGYADATLTRYITTKNHIVDYLWFQYKLKDIALTDLNYDFISNFENYFKRVRKCNHNTAMKYLKYLKAIINLAVKNDWLGKDPFSNFMCTTQPVKKPFLTEEEVMLILNKEISIGRLKLIKDAFLLSCYTGLAYIDIKNLKEDAIVTGIDEKKWLYVSRNKTSILSKVPILPIAQKIIDEYRTQNYCQQTGYIIPLPSNQKVNAYLKEIADLSGITKNLTFHVARHTFATLALEKGISIESVSAMLGHSQIRTTQIYAKVTEEKIAKEIGAFIKGE